MAGFCDTYDLRILTTEPTCYKNPENRTCIELILANYPRSFQNSCVFETGLADFHKMTVTIIKASFKRLQSKIIGELLSEFLNVIMKVFQIFLIFARKF